MGVYNRLGPRQPFAGQVVVGHHRVYSETFGIIYFFGGAYPVVHRHNKLNSAFVQLVDGIVMQSVAAFEAFRNTADNIISVILQICI